MAIRGGVIVAAVVGFLGARPDVAFGGVNLELRPPSQTVRVGNIANIGLYAVANTGVSEPVGQIRAVITWDPTFLELNGVTNDGPYVWLFSGFQDDSAQDGLNLDFTDGDALYESLAQFSGPATATPSGLLVTTLRFTALRTISSTPVSIVPQILSTETQVFNALPPGGGEVTGTLGSNTVTIICLNVGDCNDQNPCTDDACVSQFCQHVPDNSNNPVDGLFCNGVENFCQGGMIVYSTPPPNCNDGLSCTADSCDENLDQCIHPIIANRCLIAGACYSLGALNPANDCEVCNSSSSNTSWSLRPNGAACGSSADTDCDNPDTCNGSGVCQTNQSANGAACSDDGNGCTFDQCSGGACVHPPRSAGTSCGDPSDTVCTDPDICDAAGVCHVNHSSNGIKCDDGQFCTTESSCLTGICEGSGDNCPGLVCDELNDRCKGITLSWSPVAQAVLVDGEVNIDINAVSAIGENLAFNAVGVIVSWDFSRLELLGHFDTGPYPWVLSGFPNDCGLDGLNAPCKGLPDNDGNVYYEAVGQFSPGSPAEATPSGLKITTLRFRTLVLGTTFVEFIPVFGGFTQTQVLDAEVPALNILTGLGADAQVTIIQCTTDPQCNDGLFCNGEETCGAEHCIPGAYPCGAQFCNEETDDCVDCLVNSHCSDGEFCNGVEVCLNESCGPGADPCPGGFCDEDENFCYECEVNSDCNDGEICTEDTCILGFCSYVTSDVPCQDGNFCNGPERCVVGQGCISSGNPCPNPAICDENSGTCGGCSAPTATTEGTRYIEVLPPAETQPVAFFVKGIGGIGVNCVALYIQDDGTLGTYPVFKTPAQWGTVHLHGEEIFPDATYRVHADCGVPGAPVLSAGQSARLWRYGDVNGDLAIDLDDLLLLFDGFEGDFSLATLYNLDMAACEPNGAIDLDDILVMLDAFVGLEFLCARPCPALFDYGYGILVVLLIGGSWFVFRR